MLNLLEKLQYGLSGLVVLGAIGLYLWQGPSQQSLSMVPPVVEIPPKQGSAHPIKSGPASSRKAAAPAAASPQDKHILNRLAREQNVRSKSLQHSRCRVPKELIMYMSREANWQPELNKAAHKLLPGADGKKTRLKIFNIEPDSILSSKLLIQNNDIIEFIDGERIDFENDTSMDHIGRWKKLKEKMQNGGTITLTITRAGKPVQVEFKL